MIKPNKNKYGVAVMAALSIPVIWLGIIISNSTGIDDFMVRINAPFSIKWPSFC